MEKIQVVGTYPEPFLDTNIDLTRVIMGDELQLQDQYGRYYVVLDPAKWDYKRKKE